MRMHVHERIQAYLDGELTSADAEIVRNHCAACESCGRLLEELVRVQTLLQIDEPVKPIRPIWPAVSERLAHQATPRIDWRFAMESLAAAVVGVMIALFLGMTPPAAPRSEVDDVWATLGSTVVAVSGSNLSELYLSSFPQEGEQTP